MLKFLPQDNNKLKTKPESSHHFTRPWIKNSPRVARNTITAPTYAGAATIG